MPKFVVFAHKTQMYMVEASNRYTAEDAVRDIILTGETSKGRVEEDKEYGTPIEIEEVETFDYYYGNDKPSF